MGIFDKIGKTIFETQWYIFEERPIRKSMKRFSKDMDKTIAILNRTIEKYPETESTKKDESEDLCEQIRKFKRRRFI